MESSIMNFFGIAVLDLVILGLVIASFYPFYQLIIKLTEEEVMNFKKEFRRGLHQVYTYKWNILLFALLASFMNVLPEYKIAWINEFSGFSINEVVSIIFITLGAVSTLLSGLPPLGK